VAEYASVHGVSFLHDFEHDVVVLFFVFFCHECFVFGWVEGFSLCVYGFYVIIFEEFGELCVDEFYAFGKVVFFCVVFECE